MNLYDERTLAEVPWPDTAEGRFLRGYLTPLIREGTAKFVSDVSRVYVMELDGQLFPIVAITHGNENSGNLSPCARYVRFPRKALGNLGAGRVATAGMSAALAGLGALLNAGRVDDCVFVGHGVWMRQMEPRLSAEQARRLTAFLVGRFPRHAVMFYAVNTLARAPLLGSLAQAGYSFLAAAHTRMLMPHGEAPTRQERENRRRDAKLLQESGYEIIDGEAAPDCAARLSELYKALNHDKYASNPLVHTAFFEQALRDRTMTFRLARKDGRVDAFYAYAVFEDVLFSPFFGYDTSVPQEVGLYRFMVYRLVQDALDLGLAIETGAGADEFKRMRGDRGVMRHGAFYVSHLPALRRMAWGALQRYANGPYFGTTRGYLRRIDGPELADALSPVPTSFELPANGPAQAVAALREELAALRRSIDEAGALEGAERDRRLAVVSEKLNNWPQPTRLVEELKERLAQAEERARQQRKEEARKGAASSLDAAHALLERAERRGQVALVVGELEGANTQQLRAAAVSVLQRAASAVVFFASAHEGKAVLLAALTQDLLKQGLAAGALIEAVAPVVGGKGGGKPELAFGGGTRPDAIPEALSAVRRLLAERLAAS